MRISARILLSMRLVFVSGGRLAQVGPFQADVICVEIGNFLPIEG